MHFGVGQLSDGFLHLQASELHGHFHIKISCWSPGVGVMGILKVVGSNPSLYNILSHLFLVKIVLFA